jgi:hypothetical protein
MSTGFLPALNEPHARCTRRCVNKLCMVIGIAAGLMSGCASHGPQPKTQHADGRLVCDDNGECERVTDPASDSLEVVMTPPPRVEPTESKSQRD